MVSRLVPPIVTSAFFGLSMTGPPENLSDFAIPKAGDIESPQNGDVIIVAHTKIKKRKVGPVPMRKANLNTNVKQLITKIQNGKWLSDEQRN